MSHSRNEIRCIGYPRTVDAPHVPVDGHVPLYATWRNEGIRSAITKTYRILIAIVNVKKHFFIKSQYHKCEVMNPIT